MAARKSKAGYDGKIAGLYDLEDTIGRGHFAVVKLARHVFTGEKVAVKVIDKTKLDELSRSHLFQEVRCMKLVQHPNVVRLYEVIDTQTKLYLILELGDGGDMYDYIMKHTGGLHEKLAKRYFRQIVEAISYCHKLHVVHRDLKPENVVFFEKLGLVKLTDFGFSNMFAPGKKLETSCGSLAYSAPEILLGDSYDAPAVDVWSLGVILYMLVVGEAPFQEANDSETLTMIMDCRYDVPAHISHTCKDLIGKMLQREPINRASLPSILAHPWLNDGDLTPVTSFLPLITREMISEEEQGYVIQKMIEGKIASKEEITASIEKNSYNHITATYYLLVERRLRKHHQQHDHHHQQQQQQLSSGSLRKQPAASPSRSAKPQLEPLMLSPRVAAPCVTVGWNSSLSPSQPIVGAEDELSVQVMGKEKEEAGSSQYFQSLVSPPGTHPSPSASLSRQSPSGASPKASNLLVLQDHAAARKCSLIKEESLDEYDKDDDDDDVDIDAATIKPVKSLESLDELVCACSGKSTSTGNNSPSSSTSIDPVNPRRPLKSVCSSPQLLNQIHEENESEDEDDFVPLKLSMPRRFAGSSTGLHRDASATCPDILQKYDQRKSQRGGVQHGTSCSSSDASDTDDTESRSRKDKLRHKLIHRRDSSDHSSDTDGPGGNLGGNGRLRAGGRSGRGASQGSRTHSGSSRGGGGRGSNGGGGAGGGKSGSKVKKNSDNNKYQANNKNSTNNRCHSAADGVSGKGSLNDTSLKLLSRKLNEISKGMGALLSECRGSDCDKDSALHKPFPIPGYPDSSRAVSMQSLHGTVHNASIQSSSPSIHGTHHTDSPSLFICSHHRVVVKSPAESKCSPVQYLGQSFSSDYVCGCCQWQEFIQMSEFAAERPAQCSVVEFSPTHSHKLTAGDRDCGNRGIYCSVSHCKPASGSVTVQSKYYSMA